MIGIIFYMLGCFAVAAILTFLYVMMRPVHSRDELKSWRVLLVLYILTLAAPYGFDEALTRLVGGSMQAAVQEAADDSDVTGDVQYYRVVSYNGNTARVVAVTEGKASWGGKDRPVLAMTVDKDGNSWKLDSYKVIRSFESSDDGFTFPPYW